MHSILSILESPQFLPREIRVTNVLHVHRRRRQTIHQTDQLTLLVRTQSYRFHPLDGIAMEAKRIASGQALQQFHERLAAHFRHPIEEQNLVACFTGVVQCACTEYFILKKCGNRNEERWAMGQIEIGRSYWVRARFIIQFRAAGIGVIAMIIHWVYLR